MTTEALAATTSRPSGQPARARARAPGGQLRRRGEPAVGTSSTSSSWSPRSPSVRRSSNTSSTVLPVESWTWPTSPSYPASCSASGLHVLHDRWPRPVQLSAKRSSARGSCGPTAATFKAGRAASRVLMMPLSFCCVRRGAALDLHPKGPSGTPRPDRRHVPGLLLAPTSSVLLYLLTAWAPVGSTSSVMALGSWRTFERISRDDGLAVTRARERPESISSTTPAMTTRRARRRSWICHSEAAFGELFRAAGWRRDAVTVAYKWRWEHWPDAGMLCMELDGCSVGWGAWTDVYLIYAIAPPPSLPVSEVVGQVAVLIETGRARTWGTGMRSAAQLAEAVDVGGPGRSPCRRPADGVQPGRSRPGRWTRRCVPRSTAGAIGLVVPYVLAGGDAHREVPRRRHRSSRSTTTRPSTHAASSGPSH